MGEYLDVQAPQWVDFAENCSPQVPIKDFFNKVHTMHERMDEFCDSISEDIEDVQPTLQTDASCTNTKVQKDLDVTKGTPAKLTPLKCNQEIVVEEPALQTDVLCVNTNVQKDLNIIKSIPVKVISSIYHNNEMVIGELTLQTDVSCFNTKAQEDLNIMKSTPVKVISPNYRNNKEMVVGKTTYDQVLSDAMRKLELCTKPLKRRDVLNKTTQESNVFKTSSMTKLTKSSKSIGFRNVQNKYVQPVQNSTSKSVKVNRNLCTLSNAVINTKKIVCCSLFKQNEDCVENYTSKRPIDSVDSKDKDYKKYEECSKEDNEENKQEDSEEYKEEGSEERKEGDSEECKEEDNDEHKKEDDDGHKEEDEMHKKQDNKNSQDELKETMDNNKDEEEDNNDDKEKDNRDDMEIAFVKDNQRQSNKHIAVLTWHNHRRSMYKRRSVNKQFVSLAEAVSRFQNETPKRFRTRSNKDNNATTSINMSKLIQNRIKPTIPVSPDLVSKNRTRAVTVLSQEEREMQEMKKYPIKANPIPRNVLRGPRVVKKTSCVMKNLTEIANTSTMQSNENACTTNSLQSKNGLSLSQPLHHDKALSSHKNMVPKVLVTNPSGIIVEHKEVPFFGVPNDTGAVKTVTRVVPFSFEARNKELQMKKEQRLKSLQNSKAKTEFHARPAPNFSKSTPQIKQQQQQQQEQQQQQQRGQQQEQHQQQKQNTKKPIRMSVLPCPFSFEERNKQMAKRKEQMIKQVLEENKQTRMFRANPVPVFKSVMVRSTSKERLSTKNNNMKTGNEHSDKCENQENTEPNVNFSKEKNIQKTKSIDCVVDKQKVSLKDKIYPLELNTDKRARERREYDERIKRKEMEEEAKHQEQEKKRLEHLKQMQIELRKQAEVKAKPMPVFKPSIAIKATKQLTIPQSPSFTSKLKSKQA